MEDGLGVGAQGFVGEGGQELAQEVGQGLAFVDEEAQEAAVLRLGEDEGELPLALRDVREIGVGESDEEVNLEGAQGVLARLREGLELLKQGQGEGLFATGEVQAGGEQAGGLLLQGREFGAGEGGEGVCGGLEGADLDLGAGLPEEDVGDELARMDGGLQAHDEGVEGVPGLCFVPTSAQEGEPQELQLGAPGLFADGEGALEMLSGGFADQLLSLFQLVALVGQADESDGELGAENLFADLARPGWLGQGLLIIRIGLAQFADFETDIAEQAPDDAGEDAVVDAQAESVGSMQVLAGEGHGAGLHGLHAQCEQAAAVPFDPLRWSLPVNPVRVISGWQTLERLAGVGGGGRDESVDESEGGTEGGEDAELERVALFAPALFGQMQQVFRDLDAPDTAGLFLGEDAGLGEEEAEERVRGQEVTGKLLQPAPGGVVLVEIGVLVELLDQPPGPLEVAGEESGLNSFGEHSVVCVPAAGLG